MAHVWCSDLPQLITSLPHLDSLAIFTNLGRGVCGTLPDFPTTKGQQSFLPNLRRLRLRMANPSLILQWILNHSCYTPQIDTLDIMICHNSSTGWGLVEALQPFLKANSDTLKNLSIGLDYNLDLHHELNDHTIPQLHMGKLPDLRSLTLQTHDIDALRQSTFSFLTGHQSVLDVLTLDLVPFIPVEGSYDEDYFRAILGECLNIDFSNKVKSLRVNILCPVIPSNSGYLGLAQRLSVGLLPKWEHIGKLEKLQRQQRDLKQELREARAQRKALRTALHVVESGMDVLRMGLGGRDLDGGVVANVDPVLRQNVIQPLEIPEPDESSDEGYLPELEYSVLPQTASTTSMMSTLSARSSMSAVHGMPVIPSQPESQAPAELSLTNPHPNNNSESHPEETHPQSRSRSSSQCGIKSPPSSRPGSRMSRHSGYSEFAGYSRPNSVVIPFQNNGGTEGDSSHGDVPQVKESPTAPSASVSVLRPTTPIVKRSEPGQFSHSFSSHQDQLAPSITTTKQSHSTLACTLDTPDQLSSSHRLGASSP
ncbi:hypothetical protein EV359DRAFT_84624 [Lentinula novae-zelandiae]|nr:hypothetical protein EV359DRAFT_84624 [Lentinula novae-zelandiae]